MREWVRWDLAVLVLVLLLVLVLVLVLSMMRRYDWCWDVGRVRR